MVLAGPPPAHPARAGVTITVRGLNHLYGSRRGPVPVLRDVDFDVPAGGYAVLTGPSGAGKSTLLSVLGGLEAPQTGSVRVGDDDLFGLAGDQLAAYRRATVGFVFQHFGLLEMLTAAENVELAATLAGMGRPRRRARARELLAAVGLSHRLDHQPLQMSGGERQRVAIARALVNEPRLILADEPTGNLDEGSAATVLDLLESLTSAQGCTLVAVTHNRSVAARAAIHLHIADGVVARP